MSPQLKTAVVGATGYAGFELVRLLLRHPRVGAPLLLARGEGDIPANLADSFPHISGNGACPLESFSWSKLRDIDLLFLATPHEVSREWMPEAMRLGLRVIDLSGAWRLKDEANLRIYNFADADSSAAARITAAAAYGLPELNRQQISTAQLVANPGCYATSIILAIAPFQKAGWLDPRHDIICDSKSGVSGAGRRATPRTHFVEVADNLSAYSLFSHRHTGEILEQLAISGDQFVFTPHLLPIPRGILSTVYLRLAQPASAEAVDHCLREFYSGSPFVRIFTSPSLPEIRFSLHSNFCDLGWALDAGGHRLIVVSCLDNLIKGAAGQAVQNMNLMCGWDEREGLHC